MSYSDNKGPASKEKAMKGLMALGEELPIVCMGYYHDFYGHHNREMRNWSVDALLKWFDNHFFWDTVGCHWDKREVIYD